MVDFKDKTSEEKGTPINRKNLMAIQGYNSKTITIALDGTITERNEETGHTTTTQVKSNGDIVQTFRGDKVITKTIRILGNAIKEIVE